MADFAICITETQRLNYYLSLVDCLGENNNYYIIHHVSLSDQIVDSVSEKGNIFSIPVEEEFSHLYKFKGVRKILLAINRLFYELFGLKILTRFIQKTVKNDFHKFSRSLAIKLEGINFDIAFISSDRALNDLKVLFFFKRTKPCHVAILPTADYGGPAGLIKYGKRYRVKPILSFGSQDSIFNMTKTYNGKSYFPSYLIDLLSKLNILSDDHFTIGKGKSDYVGVLDKKSKDALKELNVEESKFFYVPDPEIVSLSKLDDLNYIKDQPYVLVALPQWWEHNLIDKRSHFNHLQLFIDFLKTSFIGCSIRVALHPKSEVSEYSNFLKKNNVVIVKHLKNYMKNATYFAATNSSTINWAKYFGVKTVLYDPIGLDTSKYMNELGVFIINEISNLNKKEFEAFKDRRILSEAENFNHYEFNFDSTFESLIK